MILWCSIAFALLAAADLVRTQPTTQGFISIDCGLTDGGSYNDDTTNIWYTSDGNYIDRGVNANIATRYVTSRLARQLGTVRSFPEGVRSCYTLRPLVAGRKYLVRATFLYGDYDGLHNAYSGGGKPLLFDLHIGANFWRRVNVSDAAQEYKFEAVHVAMADFIWVCLVNIGAGTPFISALELRPLNRSMYPYAWENQTNSLLYLYNYGPTTNQMIRYPDDPYDRIWTPYLYDRTAWSELTTTVAIGVFTNDYFEVPTAVLQTAVTPINSTVLSFLQWTPETNTLSPPSYLTAVHYVELVKLSGNASRWFNYTFNGENSVAIGTTKPDYLHDSYIYQKAGIPLSDRYAFTFVANENATLPPLVNAAQVYSILELPNPMTDRAQVKGIVDIKGHYGVKRNWMGDPCCPKEHVWDGLHCSSTTTNPTILSINLSSSNLSGPISKSFAEFVSIKYLDLSYNNLTGTIPSFLAELQYLQVLNLSGNHLSMQEMPTALLRKANSGLLTLSIDCVNDTLCPTPLPNNNHDPHNKAPLIIGVSIATVVALIIGILAFFFIARQRAANNGPILVMPLSRNHTKEDVQPQTLGCTEPQLFTYTQLKNIAANFTRVIGRGGFGVVYLGHMEDGTEVAVKVCSQTTFHAARQFLTEAKSLSQVHHRNLVFLVGYCNDGDNLALVYEYMAQGSLHDHLRGKSGIAKPLNWELRLKISFDAAQGLDYLHTGCMMVHRDVKSSNILLDQNLHAKVSDFGLVKIFSDDHQMSLMSTISGTPGYIDPEYQSTSTLSDKSDVYSFGVVMLEVVTGEPPIINDKAMPHITDFVSQKLASGALENIVDPRLKGEYDSNSMWKVIDLAMKCTSRDSTQRPTMAQVIAVLKVSLALESACAQGKKSGSEISDLNVSQASMEPGPLSISFGPTPR